MSGHPKKKKHAQILQLHHRTDLVLGICQLFLFLEKYTITNQQVYILYIYMCILQQYVSSSPMTYDLGIPPNPICSLEKTSLFDAVFSFLSTWTLDRNMGFEVRQMSSERKAPGCLGYIGDEILPNYVW